MNVFPAVTLRESRSQMTGVAQQLLDRESQAHFFVELLDAKGESAGVGAAKKERTKRPCDK